MKAEGLLRACLDMIPDNDLIYKAKTLSNFAYMLDFNNQRPSEVKKYRQELSLIKDNISLLD